MSSKVYQHLTPQTYMRRWQHKTSLIYAVQKNLDDLGKPQKTKDIAGLEYFYSFRAGSLGLQTFEAKRIFEPLKNYTIMINDIEIKNPLTLNKEFYDYHNWTILDSNGSPLSNEDMKALKIQILRNHLPDLEEKWRKKFENRWNTIVDTIMQQVENCGSDYHIKDIYRKELIKFMVSMEWRTLPLHPFLQKELDHLLALMGIDKGLKEIQYDEQERIYPFIKTAYEEQVHAILLSQYRLLMQDKGIIMDEVNAFTNKLTTVLLIAPQHKEFITSDNPVCRYFNKDNKLEYIFPITPKLACKLERGGPIDKYLLRNLSEKETVAINHQFKNNCHKFYILREQNQSLYF